MTAWENLSAEFERAKSAYYAAKERKAGPSETAYLEGKFNGLFIARELMAPTETRFREIQTQHEQACIDCSGLQSLVDPRDAAYRDRLYKSLQRIAGELISDAEIWNLQDSTADRDTLHFCQLALEDNDPYARFECYLWSNV